MLQCPLIIGQCAVRSGGSMMKRLASTPGNHSTERQGGAGDHAPFPPTCPPHCPSSVPPTHPHHLILPPMSLSLSPSCPPVLLPAPYFPTHLSPTCPPYPVPLICPRPPAPLSPPTCPPHLSPSSVYLGIPFSPVNSFGGSRCPMFVIDA